MVIPADMRRELGVAPGATLMAHVEGERLVLETPAHILRHLQDQIARTRTGTGSAVDALIAERRAEAAKETADEPGRDA